MMLLIMMMLEQVWERALPYGFIIFIEEDRIVGGEGEKVSPRYICDCFHYQSKGKNWTIEPRTPVLRLKSYKVRLLGLRCRDIVPQSSELVQLPFRWWSLKRNENDTEKTASFVNLKSL